MLEDLLKSILFYTTYSYEHLFLGDEMGLNDRAEGHYADTISKWR